MQAFYGKAITHFQYAYIFIAPETVDAAEVIRNNMFQILVFLWLRRSSGIG